MAPYKFCFIALPALAWRSPGDAMSHLLKPEARAPASLKPRYFWFAAGFKHGGSAGRRFVNVKTPCNNVTERQGQSSWASISQADSESSKKSKSNAASSSTSRYVTCRTA